ncbi:uncharacterized protein MELLADRAFT_112588 [Melampsora larici-populina 98AG31]|uniref:Transcription regulator Rua1 C-terminal domain-containing protein n=1 Tax=Melampsora larici-populina (strain 98AG31 / pathotype 3-4-7) TaxID=747676 RepID=F4S6Y9_MELLP|nr:uncharacterized protein MELLADRAFT_112588 [Melampsora larici-populina 98AG31]EGF99543.1 hypothetical protein MELLADRAFT_112588 [Melampsora larici-populina 98AG31]
MTWQVVLVVWAREFLLALLQEEFKASLGEMATRMQALQFEDNVYTPTYVKGFGVNKQGFCGLCKGGAWFAWGHGYPYHMLHKHGVMSVTGLYSLPPLKTKLGAASKRGRCVLGWCSACKQWMEYARIFDPIRESSRKPLQMPESQLMLLDHKTRLFLVRESKAVTNPGRWYEHAKKCHHHRVFIKKTGCHENQENPSCKRKENKGL